MGEVFGASVQVEFINGVKRITETRYTGYRDKDGMVRLKGYLFKRITECEAKGTAERSEVA